MYVVAWDNGIDGLELLVDNFGYCVACKKDDLEMVIERYWNAYRKGYSRDVEDFRRCLRVFKLDSVPDFYFEKTKKTIEVEEVAIKFD